MISKLWQGLLSIHNAFLASRARSELRELSDRTLKDIGLTRAEVDTLFR